MRSTLLVTSLVLAGCGEEAPAPAPTSSPKTAPVAASPTPAGPPPASPPPAAATDTGYCEYSVDGGAPNRGRGGTHNVMSLHWMAANQPGRSLATHLLINCGTGKQLSLSSSGTVTEATVPLGPKRYAIGPTDKPDGFTVSGPDFGSAQSGSLEITAWDNRHVAGTFDLTAQNRRYTGSFDLACPTPGNGVCER